MDTLEHYRQCIRKFLTDYADLSASDKAIETQLVFDSEHDHYLLLYNGWEQQHRVYACILHLDIKANKIWIQQNTTEVEVADELVAMGIPQSDIVVGFHSPFMRQFTEYAVS